MASNRPRRAWRLDAGWFLLAGVMLGLPIAYPTVPYYWCAFAAFFFAVLVTPLQAFNQAPGLVLGSLTMCAVAVMSNLVSPYDYVREPGRFVVTSSFYLFFLFGLIAVKARESVMRGLGLVVLVQSLAVLAMSVVGFRWSAGALNWSVPELRLWGAQWFPDWPNFYAILLSIGFLVYLVHYRKPLPALVCLAAGVLTTSRSVYLALGIGLVWYTLAGPVRFKAARLLSLLMVVAVAAMAVLVTLATSGELDEFIARMSLLSDRQEIWASSLLLFESSPWFGVGGVMLDESVGHTGHASFHNSFAEVLVRHGAVGFLVYLSLLVIVMRRMRAGHVGCAVVVFLLLAAVFQNALRHPHFFMMFSFFAIAATEPDHVPR